MRQLCWITIETTLDPDLCSNLEDETLSKAIVEALDPIIQQYLAHDGEVMEAWLEAGEPV